MKRFLQSMLLLVAMIMTAVNANAWEFTNVSPAPNSTVTELGKIYANITATFLDEFPAPTVIMTTPSGDITMIYNDGGQYFAPESNPESKLTEEGTYTLTIPGDRYHINGAANTPQVFTWTIGSTGGGQTNTTWDIASINPEAGTVESILNLQLFVPEGKTIKEIDSNKEVYINNNKRVYFSITTDKKSLETPSTFQAISTPGTYTLTIPEGFIIATDGSYNKAKTYEYTIQGTIQTWSFQGAYPAEGNVDKLGGNIELITPDGTVSISGLYKAPLVDENGNTVAYYTFRAPYGGGKNAIAYYPENSSSMSMGDITTPGRYSITIPADKFTINDAKNEEITFTWTISAPVTTLTINEDDAYAVNKIKANYDKVVNFVSDRKLSADHWNTLCLPYDVATDKFDDIITITQILETAENMFAVTFERLPENTESIWAGNPIIVKAKANNQSISEDNVLIQYGCADEDATYKPAGPGFGFCGVYGPTTLNGKYYINNDKFYYADVDIQMNGFRAYIEVPSSVANVRSFAINIEDGATTAIEEMEATGAKTATVTFDLSGKVVKAKKGIVIENGKKVMY